MSSIKENLNCIRDNIKKYATTSTFLLCKPTIFCTIWSICTNFPIQSIHSTSIPRTTGSTTIYYKTTIIDLLELDKQVNNRYIDNRQRQRYFFLPCLKWDETKARFKRSFFFLIRNIISAHRREWG